MSKTKPIKKAKRRLKRSVRRSLAAVLMITAIGVAAIPVPENVAATRDAAGAAAVDVHPPITYEDVKNYDLSKYYYTTNASSGEQELHTEKRTDSWDADILTTYKLDKYDDAAVKGWLVKEGAMLESDTLTDDAKFEYLSKIVYPNTNPNVTGENDLFQSLQIVPYGANGFELTWEYFYYTVTSGSTKKGVLCTYNRSYLGQKVDFQVTPNTAFFKVNQEDFNYYFTNGPIKKGNGTAKYLADSAHAGEVASAGNEDIQMSDENPTEQGVIEYGYKDYKRFEGAVIPVILTPENVDKETGNDEKSIRFLVKYAKGTYDSYNRIYKAYDDNLKAFIDAYKKWAEDPNNTSSTITEQNFIAATGTKKPQEPEEKVPGTATMTSLMGDDLANRINFFCENCTTLKNVGNNEYTLVRVTDSTRKGIGGDAAVSYVACKDNSGSTDNVVVNGKEFLVMTQGVQLIAIGKGALKNIQKSATITIPSNINYIGDEAFLGNMKVENLSIDNVANIGNRSFSGCTSLTSLTLTEGVETIGAECFEGCNQLTSVTLSNGLRTIGNGAFAGCSSLASLNLNALKSECTIGHAAFWDCSALSNVEMKDANIKSIGDAAFAVVNTNSPSAFEFTTVGMSGADVMGAYMFSGRSLLKTVIMPLRYGSDRAAEIPDNMFHGCFSLGVVGFPVTTSSPYSCGLLSYSPKLLFADVTNTDFYVKGPKTSDGTRDALPRVSTWDAITRVNPEPGFVPYMYVENGVEYYEICNADGYLGCIRKDTETTGTLMSYKLREDRNPPTDGKLVIPDKVGNVEVVAIDTNCFGDERLTTSVRTLVINNNIKTIGDATFKNTKKNDSDKGKWNRLAEVSIGSGIESIGAEAFADCNQLENVTFLTPKGQDYTALKQIGDNAFRTNGLRLTIHGDIKEGYQPFVYATETVKYDNGKTDVKNFVKDVNAGIRIRYQSRWDSPESKKLTVMYGNLTDYSDEENPVKGGKSGVTLLDYPHYKELVKEVKTPGTELYQYCRGREDEIYGNYASGDENEAKRTAFAEKWKEAADKNAEDAIYADPSLYGPWINKNFCSNWDSYIKPVQTSDGTTSAWNELTDWLFEPIVAEAATGTPIPYYSYKDNVKDNAYNFVDVYEENLKRANEGVNPYEGLSSYEQDVIDSVFNIVVPAGITSIDVADYFDNNANQFTGNDVPYTIDPNYHGKPIGNLVPGLFSGNIKDDTDTETETKGNDRIKSVTLTDVTWLPNYCFDNCEALTTVVLGDAMKSVGALPFRDCPKLDTLSGSEDCPANKGILYEKDTEPDGTVTYNLVECLMTRGTNGTDKMVSSETVDAPYIAALTSVDEGAFAKCNGISTVDLKDATKLKVIPEDAFRECLALSRVILPVSVNSIKSGAFWDVRSTDPDGSPRLTVTIKGKEVFIASDAFGYTGAESSEAKDRVMIETYEDTSAYEYATYYAKEGMMVSYPPLADMYSVIFMDDGTQIGDTLYVSPDETLIKPDAVLEFEAAVSRIGYKFTGWLGSDGQKLSIEDTKIRDIEADTIFMAQYESDGTTVNGRYTVEFYDGLDGTALPGAGAQSVNGKWVYYVDTDPNPSKNSFIDMNYVAPTERAHPGYRFLKWSNDWTDTMPIKQNMIVVALYEPDGSTTSGGTTNTSGTTTNTSGTVTNTSGNTTNSSTSSTSTSSSSTSTTSTTSASNSTKAKFTVLVQNGSGSGTYEEGTTVTVVANTPAAGMKFSKWTVETEGVSLMSVSLPATTFTMPAKNVTVVANYEADATPINTAGGGSGNGNTTSRSNGSTQVDITKPGISNRDLATANVNGSSDNFIVKITETDEATQAVQQALLNKYGSLDNILYYAMDISLYDSTGTTKITNTNGLSIDITIPIPDALLVYGGNNMAGAVINGSQLEDLNERFTTINGVPCISFRATHFSPYTIFVDTGNITEGTLDITPKTGDPIHPKWFLSIGLACLSIILFIKKDKTGKKKLA